jgi:hypothetical protein
MTHLLRLKNTQITVLLYCFILEDETEHLCKKILIYFITFYYLILY